MITGRGGMGSHKHGVSGRTPKSPRLRHAMRRDAEKQERKVRPTDWKQSLRDLFNPRSQ